MLKLKVHPGFTAAEKKILIRAFSDAIHETATAFKMFDHPAWQNFFRLVNPSWTRPSPVAISTDLLSEKYAELQVYMAKELVAAPAVIIGMDGATNVLSRSVSNVIAHDPRPWFVEYLKVDLKKESQVQLTAKVVDSVAQLHRLLGKDVVTAFISDSCNVMRSLRRNLLEKRHFDYTYGCGAHSLNNLCEDLLKLDSFKEILKSALFVSKSTRNQSLLSKIYSSICEDLLGKVLAMVLYSASRWSSVNYMFCRLKRVKRPITALPMAIENEKTERGIDESYALPAAFGAIVVNSQFWRSVNFSIDVFDPICKCIGVL
jgi:hypothetical protein